MHQLGRRQSYFTSADRLQTRVQPNLVEQIIQHAQTSRRVTGTSLPQVIGYFHRAEGLENFRMRWQSKQRTVHAQHTMTAPIAAMLQLLRCIKSWSIEIGRAHV